HLQHRRRNLAGDVEPGEPPLKVPRELLHDARPTTVEEVAMPGSGRTCAHLQHQVRTVDSRNALVAGTARQPDQRHAVGGTHSRAVDHVHEALVILALHDGVHRADAYVMTLTGFDPVLDRGDRVVQRLRRDPDAEDVDHPCWRWTWCKTV